MMNGVIVVMKDIGPDVVSSSIGECLAFFGVVCAGGYCNAAMFKPIVYSSVTCVRNV